MDTSLQRAGLHLEEGQEIEREKQEEEAGTRIHLPGPSYWPFVLSGAILVTIIGLLFVPETPWLAIIGAPFILLGIMGWVLEDPMGGHGEPGQSERIAAALRGTRLLDQAHQVVEEVVTFGSTAYSTHPIKVEIEHEDADGAVLTVNGKVELEAQRDRLLEDLRAIPGVKEVKNMVVAEEAILNQSYAKIDNLRQNGKLNGATNITILVENYILHLYGEVTDIKMKYALEKELLGSPGVKVIVNHINLNKSIPGNLGKTLNKVGGV